MSLEIRTPEIRGTKREDVETFLARYARAMVAGDPAALGALWEAPALVLSDRGVQPVNVREDVLAFLSAAPTRYAERGIVEVQPEVLRVEWLTERIATAEVRWTLLDAMGCPTTDETATYILRRDDTGELRARAVVTNVARAGE